MVVGYVSLPGVVKTPSSSFLFRANQRPHVALFLCIDAKPLNYCACLEVIPGVHLTTFPFHLVPSSYHLHAFEYRTHATVDLPIVPWGMTLSEAGDLLFEHLGFAR